MSWHLSGLRAFDCPLPVLTPTPLGSVSLWSFLGSFCLRQKELLVPSYSLWPLGPALLWPVVEAESR